MTVPDATATDGADVEKPLADLRSVLIPAETLEAWAIQRRIFALAHRRVLIAATSGRLVVLVRRLLGGFDVSTIRWQDLEEVTLRVGVIGADLALRAGKATDLASRGVPHLPGPGPGVARKAPGPRARGIAGAIRRDPGDVRTCPGDRERRQRCGAAPAGGQAAAGRQAHHRCGIRGHQGEDRVVTASKGAAADPWIFNVYAQVIHRRSTGQVR
jgi:hypothetical protein